MGLARSQVPKEMSTRGGTSEDEKEALQKERL